VVFATGDAAIAAATFRLDIKGAEIRQTLEAAGIQTVLLKGPALRELLYREGEPRQYLDVDLLVDPARLPVATEILTAEGFRRFDTEAPVRQTDPSVGAAIGVQGALHAEAWRRERDGFVVDVHDSFPQVGVSSEELWGQVAEHRDVLTVAGVPTITLDRPATALLVALHAAHHGPNWAPAISDLKRAIDVFDLDCWRAARDLATKLQAETPMGVGLALTPEGREIAVQLSLSTEASIGLRLLWSGEPWSAAVIESLLRQRSPRTAAKLLAQILWPTPAALRQGSALARRGRSGLLVAYGLRIFKLGSQLPRALRARRRGRS
jgi:Uncharacterised nucleotidyltransferase